MDSKAWWEGDSWHVCCGLWCVSLWSVWAKMFAWGFVLFSLVKVASFRASCSSLLEVLSCITSYSILEADALAAASWCTTSVSSSDLCFNDFSHVLSALSFSLLIFLSISQLHEEGSRSSLGCSLASSLGRLAVGRISFCTLVLDNLAADSLFVCVIWLFFLALGPLGLQVLGADCALSFRGGSTTVRGLVGIFGLFFFSR